MDPNLTAGQLLAQAADQLAAHSDSAQLDAELLLAHATGLGRTRLMSHPETPVGPGAAERFAALVARRAAGEPLAYLVGHREFWSLRLAVSPAVLVPRPETELLVERALEACPEDGVRVADLGTGSGAIALALARERPGWRIVATDVSPAALAVARANAAALGLGNVEFVEGSWFRPLAGRRFHLVLSNPPYVAEDDPALAQGGLRFEPRAALAAGPQGLDALRAIIADAPAHLEPGGRLMLEHGAGQGAAVRDELVAHGYTHVRSHRDLAGHERLTEGCRPPR